MIWLFLLSWVKLNENIKFDRRLTQCTYIHTCHIYNHQIRNEHGTTYQINLRQHKLREVLLVEDPGQLAPPQLAGGLLQDRVSPMVAEPQVADHDPE